MLGAFSAFFAELIDFQLVFFLFTAHLVIVFILAFGANQRDCNSFVSHLIILKRENKSLKILLFTLSAGA